MSVDSTPQPGGGDGTPRRAAAEPEGEKPPPGGRLPGCGDADADGSAEGRVSRFVRGVQNLFFIAVLLAMTVLGLLPILARFGVPVNASWADDTIAQHATASIGVAVALPQDKGGGLVVPTIRDAQHKSLQQISGETRALGDKARQQGLTIEEMADATFTVSNLGMLGVDHFEAIINPPQAAILAVGAALEKPVVREGQLTIGREMTCTIWSFAMFQQ